MKNPPPRAAKLRPAPEERRSLRLSAERQAARQELQALHPANRFRLMAGLPMLDGPHQATASEKHG